MLNRGRPVNTSSSLRSSSAIRPLLHRPNFIFTFAASYFIMSN